MRLNVQSRLACGLAALIAWLMIGPVQAQTPAVPVVVRIAPASVQVAAGETVDVAVEVVDVVDLYAFDVTVTFDPQVVEVVDADPNLPGVQVAQGLFLDPGFAVINAADNTAGSAHFVMTQLNPSGAKSGTGSLVVVKLLGKQVGASSPLTVEDPELARRDGSAIPATPESGQVDVIAAGGPTSTPMPTQGAGTPMATTTPEPTTLPSTATPQPTALPATATSGPTQLPPTATADLSSPAPPSTRMPPNMGTPQPSYTPAPDATMAPTATATGASAGPIAQPPEPTSSAIGQTSPATALAEAPATSQATAAAVGQAQPGDDGPSQDKSSSRSRSLVLLAVMIVGGLAFAAGAVALAVWYLRRQPRAM